MSDKDKQSGHHHNQEPLHKKESEIYNEEAQFHEEPQFQEDQRAQPKSEPKEQSKAEALVDSKTNPAAASAKRIKRVDSGEQVLQGRNIPSGANDNRDSGIVIRIKSLEEVGYLPAKVLIEIRNETNLTGEDGNAPTRQTKLVPKHDPIWDEDFYYNNNVMLDDNITFILRGENQREQARTQVRNLSLLKKEQDEQDTQIERELVKLELKREDQVIAKLLIEISFYEREDILGGVMMPNLSLRPPPNFKAQYNAIDTYKPEFKNQPGSRANCFNFYDAGILPGLDNVEVFPPKIARRNRKVIEAE